jgi:hypothetical protein
MPPEADADTHTWTEWGIRSNLVIPVLARKSVAHVISMNSVKSGRTWPGDLIPRLQLLGGIFVNLEPRRMQLQLTQALRSRNGGDCRRAWEGIYLIDN